MPERTGKCSAYTKCTLAYRNQLITVSGNFVCPECGAPLREPTAAAPASSKQRPLIIGGIAAGLLALACVIYFVSRPPKEPEPQPNVAEQTPPPVSDSEVVTPPPIDTPPPDPPPPVATVPDPAPPAPDPEPPPTEPPAPVTVEEKVNVDPQNAANKEIKNEVLTRIDAMPKLTAAEKSKLYAHVDRARGMGKVITIPFASGQSTLSAKDIEQLKTATQSPQVVKLLNDPTVVFVVLGFADTKGEPAANLRISTSRAESAVQALKEKCNFLNIMHPVGMGGSALFDAGDNARNRVVEVWAVVP